MAVQAYNANDPYEQLIANMLVIERQPQLALKSAKSDQEIFKGVLSDLDRTLSGLHTTLKTLTDAFTNPFAALKASVPKEASFGASVSARAARGAHTLTVERLATNDARVSRQLAQNGADLRAYFDQHGAQTFQIEVASPTTEAPDRRVAIDVTVDPTGATDGEILDEVRAAIASALSAAADAGDVRRQDLPAASIVRETSDTARLSLRSGGTGYANRLAFTDSADGLLGQLGLFDAADPDRLAEGTGGGQLTAVGASDATSLLNAQFELDGLTLYRSTNQVSDALDGVTLTLHATGEQTAFSIGSDTEAVTKTVEDFITKYNAVLDYVKKKTAVDGAAGTRATFADDSAVRGLRFGMRTDLIQRVGGLPADAPDSLTALGIEIAADGTLKLADKEALLDAVGRDPEAVQRLFTAEDGGLATRLLTRLDAFLGRDGIIASRRESNEARIKRLDKQITDWDDKLARREEQLRLQYARLQETLALLQGQQQSFSAYLYY